MPEKIRRIFSNENFVDLTLYQYGSERCEPLHAHGPVTFNHYIFHFILSGRGRLRVAGPDGKAETHRMSEGQGFLICPRQACSYIADEVEPWSYVWVEFDGLRAKELMAQAGLTPGAPVYNACDPEQQSVMERELLWLSGHPNAPPLEVIGHLYLFVGALIQSSSARKRVTGGRLRDFYVREALNYIQQHYQERVLVEDIAAYCNINRNYLTRIFRSVLDAGPQEFLLRYRMGKACELLTTTELPVGEIGALVGYPNPLNFSRTFKHMLGMSPRAWKQEHGMAFCFVNTGS